MSQHAGFLRAILDDPDDDGVRLVYADWLDEHGQPERAEFIRVQCELALAHEEGREADVELWGRSEDLRTAHGIARRLSSVMRHTSHGKRDPRSEPVVSLAALQPSDSAASLLARLYGDRSRAAVFA